MVYLIRHTTPDWSRKDLVYHLPPGPPLTDQGLAEAHALGKYLMRFGVARLYTSPLERSLQTAKIAAGIIGAQVQVDERLIEWQPDETAISVCNRLCLVFELAFRDSQNGLTAGLISHGGPIGALLGCLGIEDETLKQFLIYDSGNPLPPAGVCQVARSGEAKTWQLKIVFVPKGKDEQIRL